VSPLTPLPPAFFARDGAEVAFDLVGKVLCRREGDLLLCLRLIETEAYFCVDDKASHSSLGRTPSREPMFAPPGTWYLYHSRAGPSLNISVGDAGDAVLFKAAIVVDNDDKHSDDAAWQHMLQRNPRRDGGARDRQRLASGQALLCRCLGLDVPSWSGRTVDDELFIADDGDRPAACLQTPRLGIPDGRDAHLPLRFVDERHAARATKNPLPAWRRRDPQVRRVDRGRRRPD